MGKIELCVELTEEQKKIQENILFGATKNALVTENKKQNSTGIGFGQQSFQKQQELIEMKKQGQQGVQRTP